MVRKIIRMKKLRADDEAMTTLEAAGAVAAAGVLIAVPVYWGVTQGWFNFPANKTPAQGTGMDLVEVGQKHIITADEFSDLSKELKSPFGQGKFLYGEVYADAGKALHGKVIMEVDGKPVEHQLAVVDPAGSQAFLQDLLDTHGAKADVHFVPTPGDMVLTGKDAQDYALHNLSMTDAGNVSKVVIKANRDYVANESVGAAKVYFDGKATTKPIALDYKQIDAAFDVFENAKAGDLAKITGKGKVAKIGSSDVKFYVAMTDYAENKLGLGDQWANDLEVVLANIEQHFKNEEAKLKDTSASAFENGTIKGTWDSIYAFADNIANMTGKHVEIADNLTKFNETKDKAGAVTYLMKVAQVWADAKDDGLVDPTTYRVDWVSPTDAGNKVNASKNAVLNVWRDDIWSTYSNLNGTNYLAVKYNITDRKQLNDKDADALWTISQELLRGASYAEGKRAGLTEILTTQGNADALVLSAGSDGAKLDSWLDLLGQAGRFDYAFDHSANGTDAYNNFTKEATKANVVMPTNLTVKYDLNRYTFRITDTRDGGSLMTFYNKDGNLLTTETRILNADQTKFVKTWAKNYGAWSGSTEDA